MTVPGPGSTADLTQENAPVTPPADPAVNAAQMTNQTSVPPTRSPSDPEERIRALMSQRDKTTADFQRAVAEQLRLQQQLEAERAERERIQQAAAQNTQQILSQQQQITAALEQQKAENLRLAKLVQYPELREYAVLLPLTTDENMLNQAIATLLAARQRDIEAAKQSAIANTPPAAPQQPATPPLYPNNQFTPPIAPARPAPTAAANTADPFQVHQDLRAKVREAWKAGDTSIFERAAEEAARIAAAQYQQQG